MIGFEGQVAIVTGGGRGLGRAHALDLAKRGAFVVVNDVGATTVSGLGQDAAIAEAVVAEIIAMGGEAMADSADVADAAATEALVARVIAARKRVDVLVCNAGNQRFLRFGETARTDYDSLVDIHLGGSFNMARACWPHMVAQDYGRIIFTCSQVGFYGQVDAVAYGAAKNGVLGLMHGMKLDALAAGVSYLASQGCTLNGEVLIAGGGHFAIARTIETLGIHIADPSAVTAEALAGTSDIPAALSRYESERLPLTSAIVHANRRGGPEAVIDAVERLAPQGFGDVDAVMSRADRQAILQGYAQKICLQPVAGSNDAFRRGVP